ncbi:MAG: hypothetical protein GC180_00245 [Bacteroidetes bacterium]|nr:hypothetical protein [Bacteroidota bacterium]
MKHCLFLISIIVLLAACGGNENEPFKKTPLEISHFDEDLYHFDTLIVDQADSNKFSIDLSPIPGYFVLGQNESDSFIEAHFYQDLALVIRKNNDSLYITKDSLINFVNKDYLNEALLEDVHLMIFEPSISMYLIEFAVRKPWENDRFHFQVLMHNDAHQISIVDE